MSDQSLDRKLYEEHKRAEALAKDNEDLRSTITSLQARLEAAEEENGGLKESLRHCSEALSQANLCCTRLNGNIEDLLKEQKQAESRAQQAEGTIKYCNDILAPVVGDMAAPLEHLSRNTVKLIQQAEEMRDRAQQNAHKLGQELAAAKERIGELESIQDGCVSKIRVQKDEIGDLHLQRQKLQATIASQSEELERLRAAAQFVVEEARCHPTRIDGYLTARLSKALSHSTKAEGENS